MKLFSCQAIILDDYATVSNIILGSLWKVGPEKPGFWGNGNPANEIKMIQGEGWYGDSI